MGRFGTRKAWYEHCAELIRKDWDVFLLYDGDPGTAKSTTAAQDFIGISKELGRVFTPEQMCFTFEEWHQTIKERDAFWDEADLNKRMAMHGSTKKFLREVKDNRAQNRIQGVAFNSEFDLDDQVKWQRVRFRIHKPKRDEMALYRPEVHTKQTKTGYVRVGRWVLLDRWRTKPNTGPWWSEYEERKQVHMDTHGVEDTRLIHPEAAQPVIDDILAALAGV